MTTHAVKAFSTLSIIAAALAVLVKLRLSALGLSPVLMDLPDLPSLGAPNHRLSPSPSFAIEKLGDGDLLYPESLARSPDGRHAFVSLGDGRIVRLETTDPTTWDDVTWTTLVRTGEPGGRLAECGAGGPTDMADAERDCGRPLGLLLVDRSTVEPNHPGGGGEVVLLVADSVAGFLMVTDIFGDGGARLRTLATRAASDSPDRKFKLLNALAQTPDGAIYLTETSTRFARRRILHAAMDGRPTGRLLRYLPPKSDGEEGSVEVLVDGLYMPNGIVATHDGSGLLIVCGVSIRRYDLRLGRMDPAPFASMQGTGDNLKAFDHLPTGEEKKCYWAALGGKYAKPFSLLKFLADKPLLRSLVLAAVPYEKIVGLIPKWTAVVVYDEGGELIDTYRDDPVASGGEGGGGTKSGSIAPWLSEAEPLGKYLILASWYNPFLARVRVHAVRES